MGQTQGRDTRGVVYYADNIQGRGRMDLPTPSQTNASFTPVQVVIHDARPERDSLTLETAGFVFAKHRCPVAVDPRLFEQNMTRQDVSTGPTAQYETEVAEFIKNLTGAAAVLPQAVGGVVARTSVRAERKSWAPPANFVHLDFTPWSADKFLHWSVSEEEIAKHQGKRFVVYQAWRAISPGPQDNTLTICDGSSVSPDEAVVIDMVIADEQKPGGKFEIRLCRPNIKHRWYYLPSMEPDDLLVFKAYDSEMPLAMNAMHTAFEDLQAGPDAIPRRSLESRFYAFFDQ